MRTILLLTIAGLMMPITSALAEESPAIKADQDRLHGEWSMVSGTLDGYSLPDIMVRGFKRVCKEGETIVTNGDQLIMSAKITIDPSQNPKTIDYQVVDGPTKGQTHLGIYELEGDTMKSCFGAPGMERPTDFTSKAGDKRTSSVWQRNKKQE